MIADLILPRGPVNVTLAEARFSADETFLMEQQEKLGPASKGIPEPIVEDWGDGWYKFLYLVPEVNSKVYVAISKHDPDGWSYGIEPLRGDEQLRFGLNLRYKNAVLNGSHLLVSGMIVNTLRQNVLVERPYLPLDNNGPMGDLFIVQDAKGREVRYTGALPRPLQVPRDDYLLMRPGQTISWTIDLGAYYDLGSAPSYTINELYVEGWLEGPDGNPSNVQVESAHRMLEVKRGG
jgi:hypothetical protein